MRRLLSSSRALARAIALSLVFVCCANAPGDDAPTSAGEIIARDEGVSVGPRGGGVRDPDGGLSVIIPAGALDAEVTIAVALSGPTDGARGTPHYRVTVTPPVTLLAPAQVILDLARSAGASLAVEAAALRLASGPAPNAPPSSPLGAVDRRRLSASQFAGATIDLDRVFGLVEAHEIDCGGATCNTCCLEATRLSCNGSCGLESGEIVVECLRDRDCGAGLKCCAPSTQRGGGVLRIDDDRITCKPDCGDESVHVCDMNDEQRCATCSSAKPGCSRGYCGAGPKTPTQLLCP